VLLVEDSTLFRESLRHVLDAQADLLVVGEASDADEGVTLAERLAPDLILMDVNLGEKDGIAATALVKTKLPDVVVVMLTVDDDVNRLFEATRAGATGYLLKNIGTQELLDQIRGMARGEAPISRRMATKMLSYFHNQADTPSNIDAVLTAREVEVLELIEARLSNKEIAARLVISEFTVKNHIKSILAKLHVSRRRQAAARGAATGLFRRRPHSAP
jgi:DNA-binding NarL/FixJ family response regulator